MTGQRRAGIHHLSAGYDFGFLQLAPCVRALSFLHFLVCEVHSGPVSPSFGKAPRDAAVSLLVLLPALAQETARCNVASA